MWQDITNFRVTFDSTTSGWILQRNTENPDQCLFRIVPGHSGEPLKYGPMSGTFMTYRDLTDAMADYFKSYSDDAYELGMRYVEEWIPVKR